MRKNIKTLLFSMTTYKSNHIEHKLLNHQKKILHFLTKWQIVHSLHLNFLVNFQQLNMNAHKSNKNINLPRFEGRFIANPKIFIVQDQQEEQEYLKVANQQKFMIKMKDKHINKPL
jgi:hypothetical protein